MKKVMFFVLMSAMLVFASCTTGNDPKNNNGENDPTEQVDSTATPAEGDEQVAGAEEDSTKEAVAPEAQEEAPAQAQEEKK